MSIPNCKRVCLCLTLFIAQSTSLLVVDRQTKEKERSNNLPQGGQHIQNIACNSAISKEGRYQYEVQNSDVDCSLFIIGEANQLLEMSFDAFDVSCEGDGFLMLIDGWLIEDEIFPSDNDYPQAVAAAGQRYREFCGVNSPRGIYVSSQNIFQLHFKVHGVNQGFRLSLRLRHNPQPCNMLLRAEQGSVTLRNYGQRINCSVFIVSPASIQVNNISISANRRLNHTSQGILWKCRSHQTRDYVEMLDGDGFDPTYMWRVGMLDVCASIMQPKLQWPQQFMLGCQRSAVRLVSSGNFFMSLNVTYHTLTDDELTMVQDLPC